MKQVAFFVCSLRCGLAFSFYEGWLHKQSSIQSGCAIHSSMFLIWFNYTAKQRKKLFITIKLQPPFSNNVLLLYQLRTGWPHKNYYHNWSLKLLQLLNWRLYKKIIFYPMHHHRPLSFLILHNSWGEKCHFLGAVWDFFSTLVSVTFFLGPVRWGSTGQSYRSREVGLHKVPLVFWYN